MVWLDDADEVDWDWSDGQTEDRQVKRQPDRQLERSDDLVLLREIVKGLMVMKERAQSYRQIIRQAANAELLAADNNQTRSTSICHVYLS